jgi:Rod binding domain-containing protein
MLPISRLLPDSVRPSTELSSASAVSPEQKKEMELRQSAQDFEAAYIAQMLTFSGLDKALTSGGGEEVAAFTSFYIESFADQIAEKGGFGLAENFYERLLKLDQIQNSQNNLRETETY